MLIRFDKAWIKMTYTDHRYDKLLTLWPCWLKKNESRCAVASHAGVFRGARISSLPTNACSTENNIPFPLFNSLVKRPINSCRCENVATQVNVSLLAWSFVVVVVCFFFLRFLLFKNTENLSLARLWTVIHHVWKSYSRGGKYENWSELNSYAY